MDPDLKALFQMVIESQARTDKSVGELTTLLSGYVELSDTRFTRLEEAQLRTEQAIANLAVSGNARMIRIEENLDGLIRAITSEHSNGKSH